MRVFGTIVSAKADLVEQLPYPRDLRGFAFDELEDFDGFEQDVANAPAWVEASVGRLEDHLQAMAQLALLLGAELGVGEVDAVDADAASRGWQQADDHARDSGFTGAAFADQGVGAAALDAEADVIDCGEQAALFAAEQARQPGLRKIEAAREPLDLDEAQLAVSCACASQHATLLAKSSGRRWRQRSEACSQRG